MTKSLLLICICSVVFHHCAGEETIVRGFIGLNTLRRKAILRYDSVEQFKWQRILPSVNFSCSGTISKWTFVARSQTGRGRDQYPQFQLWRPSGTEEYERVYESTSDGGRFTASQDSGITIEEYSPHDLVPFRSDDVLGVYQPGDDSDSRLSLVHVSVPPGFGHDNYIRQTEMSLVVFTTSAQGVGNDIPLVAVNTTSPQCMQGFLNEEAVRIAAAVYATSDTYNIRSHDRQQRIIPGIKFTCTGTLTKWIIGAQRTVTQATNPRHLQLQIWRLRQGSTNTYYRTTFSDITELNTTDDLNVYEYIPNQPLDFRANDFLGLYQPRIRDTQVEVYYQIGGAPRNFARYNRDSPVTSNFITYGGVGNDLPLVTVEVNGESAGSCTEGFITRERLADEALLIGDFAEMYGQQVIIPEMIFTSSGSILSWTFAAQYDASATQYPELQVWRENTTGRYVKVGSTVNMEPIQTAYLNVYKYVLDPPLQVLAGDVFGIHQPSSGDSRVHLLFLTDSNHVNWYTNASNPQDSFMVADSPTNNVLPLVALSFELEGTALPVRSSSELLVPTTLSNPGSTPPPVTSSSALSLQPTTLPNPGGTPPPVTSTSALSLIPTTLPNPGSTSPPVTSTSVLSLIPTTLPNPGGTPPPVTSTSALSLQPTPLPNPGSTSPPVTSTSALSLIPTPLPNPGGTPPPVTSTSVLSLLPTTLPNPGGTPPPVTSTTVLSLLPTTLPNPGSTPPPVTSTSALSLRPTPGSDRSLVNESPAGAIAGALVGVMVVVVVATAVVLLVVLVLRKRQRKRPHEPDTQEKTVENPIYAGEAGYQPTGEADYQYAEVDSKPTHEQSVYHNYHTLEPDSASQENQPQYEVPVPQQHNVHMSNERYATCYSWGLYVPTESDRRAFKTTPGENIYASLSESQYSSVGPDPTFFEESATYWSPASDSEGLYQQLADKKYREILRHQVQITEHLGSGQFGTVNKGIWQSPAGAVEVAVKTLKRGSDENDRVKFLQEAAINGQFRHPNIVKLLGVITVGEPVMIVLELLMNGDLRNYLIKQRPVPGEMVPSNTSHTLLVFCKDVASGMQYLAGKSFVHRDLAARNILVAEDKTCKIADFGMSRDLMDENYYVSHGGQIPVKWTAPEALHFKKYSTASDVWSYGAVTYEIWSLGHKPFEEYSNLQAMKLVDRGYRLPPPPGCPKAMYELMIKCWNADKPSRPDFAELVHTLSSPVTDLLSWSEEDMRVHPQAAVLGAPLEAGKDLYPELQGTYMYN